MRQSFGAQGLIAPFEVVIGNSNSVILMVLPFFLI